MVVVVLVVVSPQGTHEPGLLNVSSCDSYASAMRLKQLVVCSAPYVTL